MAVGIPQLLLIVAISTFENDTMLRIIVLGFY